MNLHAFTLGADEIEVWLARTGAGYRVHTGGTSLGARLRRAPGAAPHEWILATDAGEERVSIARDGDTVHVHLGGRAFELTHLHILDRLAHAGHGAADDVVSAQMPGTLVALHVGAGSPVKRGAALLVIESMKLETTIAAPRDAIVRTVHVEAGRSFERGAVLITLEPAAGGV